MGTAPYSEFVLISPAAEDKKPDLMPAKALNELSAKTIDGHPSMLLLFPGTGAAKEPKLVSREGGHWVILIELPAVAGRPAKTRAHQSAQRVEDATAIRAHGHRRAQIRRSGRRSDGRRSSPCSPAARPAAVAMPGAMASPTTRVERTRDSRISVRWRAE